MVAAKLANLGDGQRADLKARSANWRTSDYEERETPITQSDAAGLLNVSERAIQRAKVVQDKGDPELVAKVERNEVSVSAAADIATLPAEQQRAAAISSTCGWRDIRGRRSPRRWTGLMHDGRFDRNWTAIRIRESDTVPVQPPWETPAAHLWGR